MFFSILIPVYNVERYLNQCIDSVLSQELQDYEIVLMDDGSTDNSGAICDEYLLNYPDKIRVIHKQNEGLLLTRRKLIREAKGEWLVHLDSDDYMMPGALKAIREIAIKYHADLVIGSFIFGQTDENDLSKRPQYPFTHEVNFSGDAKYNLLMQFLYRGSMTAIWQKIAKREIVDIDRDYSEWPGVSMMEDHLQSLPLIDRSTCPVYLDKAIVYYRFNKEGITKQKSYKSCEAAFWSMVTVYKEEKKYRDKWNINEEDNRAICAKHLRLLCLKMADMFTSTERKRNRIKPFIRKIAGDSFLHKEYDNANKVILGRRAHICFFLAFHYQIRLLRILMKYT